VRSLLLVSWFVTVVLLPGRAIAQAQLPAEVPPAPEPALEAPPPALGEVPSDPGVTADPAAPPSPPSEAPAPEQAPAVEQAPPPEQAPEQAVSAPSEDVAEEGIGRIEGVVTSKEDGFSVADAHVFVRGEPGEASTDGEGRFSIDVRAGVHSVTVIVGRYTPQAANDIRVRPGATTEVNVELTPSNAALEDFLITAPFVEGGVAAAVAERRQTKVVAEVIGAEQMSRSGDSSAASALRRVTGLTVVGGKYIYVRGMGDRYSSTLLNDLRVPSPEPDVRVVPLDLFPSGLLDSVLVQKSYSPDMPGDFGGGVISMRTRGYPDEFTLSVQAGLGGNTRGTLRKAHSYESGSYDWLGFDDGDRAMPEEAATSNGQVRGTQSPLNPDGYSRDDVNEIGSKFGNRYELDKKFVLPNGNLSVIVGNSFQIAPKARWGFAVAGLYSHIWNHVRNREWGLYGAQEQVIREATGDTLEREVFVGSMFDTGLTVSDDHKLKATTMLMRQTTDETLYQDTGFATEFGGDFQRARYRFVERQLLSQQVGGEHRFVPLNKLKVDWKYAFSKATRDEPDRIEWAYQREVGQPSFELAEGGGNNMRLYSELKDQVHDARIDFTQPVPVWRSLEANLKAGGAIFRQERNVETRRFVFEPRGTPRDLVVLPPEELLTPENVGSETVFFEERTLPTDPYEGEVKNYAGYGALELPIVESLDVMGGVRVEKFDIEARTSESLGKVDTLDYLPAGSITWRFIESWQARGSFSQTVNRPDLRELVPSQFNDVETGVTKKGNPDLKPATIRHYDARVEWYLSGDESVSLGGFYKTFDDPIEQQFQTGAVNQQTWANADAGYNMGVEIEGRKRLDFMHRTLRDLFFSSNVALIKSEVKLDKSGAETNKNRALAGQSPWVLNVQLGYEGAANGLNASVLYNVAGERIYGVGVNEVDDVYDLPFHQLDFVLTKDLKHGFRIGAKARNMLNGTRTLKQGDLIFQRWKPGTDLQLNLSWNL
jgi:outer membrane receptor protein involved in Fe transport